MNDEGKVAVLSLKEIEKVNLVIADAGHLAQWEQPERFNLLLEKVIEEVR